MSVHGGDDLEIFRLRFICHEVVIVNIILGLVDVLVEGNLLMYAGGPLLDGTLYLMDPRVQ